MNKFQIIRDYLNFQQQIIILFGWHFISINKTNSTTDENKKEN